MHILFKIRLKMTCALYHICFFIVQVCFCFVLLLLKSYTDLKVANVASCLKASGNGIHGKTPEPNGKHLPCKVRLNIKTGCCFMLLCKTETRISHLMELLCCFCTKIQRLKEKSHKCCFFSDLLLFQKVMINIFPNVTKKKCFEWCYHTFII